MPKHQKVAFPFAANARQMTISRLAHGKIFHVPAPFLPPRVNPIAHKIHADFGKRPTVHIDQRGEVRQKWIKIGFEKRLNVYHSLEQELYSYAERMSMDDQ